MAPSAESNLVKPPAPVVHTPENTPGKSIQLPIPTSSLRIVSASYFEGPTGMTVFLFPSGKATGVLDIRGGSPGHLFPKDGPLDAVVLSGGSVPGLQSGTGVADAIWQSRNFDTSWGGIPLVRGAIIFDYTARKNSYFPDAILGRLAGAAALSLPASPSNIFFPGQIGGGCSASVGKSLVTDPPKMEFAYAELAGQGAGFRMLGRKPRAEEAAGPEEDVWVAAFVVCNAVGHIVDRSGRTVRGHVDPAVVAAGEKITPDTKRLNVEELIEHLKSGTALEYSLEPPPELSQPAAHELGLAPSTTISLVVTNLALPQRELSAVARQVHASMGRAIQPLANLYDGDQLWCVSTNEVVPSYAKGTDWGSTIVGLSAGQAMWDAILGCY